VGREDVPSADEVIELLGGAKLMERIRAERSAEERYPTVMPRLRRILEKIPDSGLHTEIALFLERVVLSKSDGPNLTRSRVNLLTLHSTKGLEFSRVYVVGAEDGQLPGNKPNSEPDPEEVEEGRRLLYVGMTRTRDRLVLTRVEQRDARSTGGHRFLDEMGLIPQSPS
jgi:superfamily I DNA/RNA helicase